MVTIEEINDICERAVKTWGVKAQEDMMIEESSELIIELSKLVKAILKLRRKHDDAMTEILLYNIISEMVDVKLMLIQMETIFVSDEASRKLYDILMKTKIDRVKEMLGNDKRC